MRHAAPSLALLLVLGASSCGERASDAAPAQASPAAVAPEEPAAPAPAPSPTPKRQPSAEPKPEQLPADPRSDAELVQADVRILMDALYEKGDVETLLRHTHPKLLKRAGGADALRPLLEMAVAGMKEQGIRRESLEFPEPPIFVETAKNDFAVVPTLSVLAMNGQRVESLNFQLGVRRKGTSDWKYIEGSRLDEIGFHELFPAFPRHFAFPETYRKKL